MQLTYDQEQQRLDALYRYDILDTPREESFDRIARLARLTMNTPITQVVLLDRDRQWVKAACGTGIAERPRRNSFCSDAIRCNQPTVIPDARGDPRYRNNPLVAGEPHLRFYCGVPLTTPDGFNIGTLCAIDTEPREVTAEQVEGLRDLARMVVDELELRRLASTDSLTGALTLRSFASEMKRSVSLTRRHKRDLGLIVFDLDDFKSVNDTLGHGAGDSVIRAVVSLCLRDMRATDIFGRTGGEEFAIALPETGLSEALRVAERLRGKIGALTFPEHSPDLRITASFGVTTLHRQDRGFEQTLERADAAMYAAKQSGCNAISVAPLRPAVMLRAVS